MSVEANHIYVHFHLKRGTNLTVYNIFYKFCTVIRMPFQCVLQKSALGSLKVQNRNIKYGYNNT